MSNSRFWHLMIVFCMVGTAERASRASDDGQTTSRPQTAPASQPQSAPATQPQSAPASQPRGKKGYRPITLIVTDAKTQKPITEFVCTYDVFGANKQEDRHNYEGIKVQSPTGTIQIDAPRYCLVRISVKARDYIDKENRSGSHEWEIRSDDENRVLGVTLTPGTIFRGIVKDARTGTPVQDAEVCPLSSDGSFLPRSFPIKERMIRTDGNGRFELHGVDIRDGIRVEHPDYLPAESTTRSANEVLNVQPDGTATAEISLAIGKCIRGAVRDLAGKPVEGATVDGGGKSAATNKDGEFVLKSVYLNYGGYVVHVKKEGYVSEYINVDEVGSLHLAVALKPQREIVGRVLDEEGQPVRKYTLCAVPCLEDGYPTPTYGHVDDPDGRFVLRIDKDGLFWFGIKAEGHVFWETRRDTKEIVAPLDVRLPSGSSVRGKVVPPDGVVGPFQIRLAAFTPKEDRSNRAMEARESLARVDGTTGQDGTIQLDHVRPGGYVVFLYGPTITPIVRWLVVEDKETNLGTLHPQGTGTVFGQAYQTGNGNGDEKAFASGHVGYSFSGSVMSSFTGEEAFSVPSLSFRTDEDGKFRVDGVPVGNVSVYFAALNPWAHRIDCVSRYANVAAGQATEVRFFDPTGGWDVSLNIKIGDGSNAHWASGSAVESKHPLRKDKDSKPRMTFVLKPVGAGPLSYPVSEEWEVSPVGGPVLHDVHEGRYRLSVKDEEGDNCWGKQEFQVKARMNPIEVRLGAGSIVGGLDEIIDAKYETAIWLVRTGAGTDGCSYTGEERDGHFACRYLHPGTYVLYAVNPALGWCRLGPIRVNNEMVDVGALPFVPGGAIAGRFKLMSGKPMPYSIHATDASGMDIRHGIAIFNEPEGTEFSFTGLWPGEWTVQLRGEHDVLAEGKVTVKTGETVHVDLIWK